ncbi:MAG: DoxX family membrane protein [Bacteroidota bacterium]
MKQKILFVICLLFGLLMINGGLDKFLHYMPMPKDMPESMIKAFTALTAITWLMPLVGFIEILGGILFIIPKTRALGAIVIFPVVIGILLTNTVTEPSGAPIALVVLAINLWVIFENREKYMPMIR